VCMRATQLINRIHQCKIAFKIDAIQNNLNHQQ